MYLIEGLGLVHEKIDVSTGPYFFCFLLNCNSLTLHPSLCFEFYYSTTLLQKRNKDQVIIYISHKLNTAGSLFTSIYLHLPSTYLKIKITVK